MRAAGGRAGGRGRARGQLDFVTGSGIHFLYVNRSTLVSYVVHMYVQHKSTTYSHHLALSC